MARPSVRGVILRGSIIEIRDKSMDVKGGVTMKMQRVLAQRPRDGRGGGKGMSGGGRGGRNSGGCSRGGPGRGTGGGRGGGKGRSG